MNHRTEFGEPSLGSASLQRWRWLCWLDQWWYLLPCDIGDCLGLGNLTVVDCVSALGYNLGHALLHVVGNAYHECGFGLQHVLRLRLLAVPTGEAVVLVNVHLGEHVVSEASTCPLDA